MANETRTTRFRFSLWLIRVIGVIVPRRLRADWRQEWEAELRYRERLLAEWDRLDWRNKLELLRRSLSAFWDALCLQPERWEDEMIQDLRYGARMLLKSPAFTLVVALSLALGIGANTVVFSLLDAVLLKTLPVKEPERLVLFRWLMGEKTFWISTNEEGGLERDEATGLKTGTSFSYPAFEHFRANNQSLSETFAFKFTGMSLNIDGQAEVARGQLVSGNYFVGLGLPALLGRTLSQTRSARARLHCGRHGADGNSVRPGAGATRYQGGFIFGAQRRRGQTSYSRSRLSKGLVVTQVAMSLVLLFGAGLFVRTLGNLTRIDLGFNRENLLLFNANPGAMGYKGDRLANLYQRLLERSEAIPGVRSATASGGAMLGGSGSSGFCIYGYTPEPGEKMILLNLLVAAGGYDAGRLSACAKSGAGGSINRFAL